VSTPDPATCPVALLQGKKLTIKVNESKPAKNKLSFQTKGSYALPGKTDAPTDAGATLRIVDAAGQDVTFALPATLWKGLGKDASKGFSYKDTKRTAGPCTTVQLKGGKQIKASCKGDKLTLGPTFVEPVQVIIRAGHQSYCSSLGGKVNNKGNGTFTAKAAAAPADCSMALLP
jgi:hypothetical protein